jgi:calcineurin-like phosphoesterase family protein
MEQRWFTSDEHYDHNNIITFCKRPYKDTEEMRQKLIDNHNAVVKPGDLVYHLGDMFWRTYGVHNAISTVKSLNGQHFYVYGNHDELFRNKSVRDCFVWCKDMENLKISGLPNIVLCHYAMRVWNGSHRGAYQLYGHTHAVLPEDSSLSMDVGVDARNYAPISLDAVVEHMRAKEEKFKGKSWLCPKCHNQFAATDTAGKLCSKCLTEMRLV